MELSPIRPIHEYMIVERDEEQEKTHGGIIIPVSSREKAIRGTILATGTGRVLPDGSIVEPWANPGDRVLYSKHCEGVIHVNHEDYLVIEDQDLFAKIEGEDDGETLVPVKDRLTVEIRERQRDSEIILTDEFLDDHLMGEVVAKGEKVSVEEGDLILFNKVDGLEFESNGKTFLMLREQDVYGVLEYT